MQRSKKIASVLLSVTMLSGACAVAGSTTAHASGTGAGLAEWALNAYYCGWSYVYGGATPGTVDCSGLFLLRRQRKRRRFTAVCIKRKWICQQRYSTNTRTRSSYGWSCRCIYRRRYGS